MRFVAFPDGRCGGRAQPEKATGRLVHHTCPAPAFARTSSITPPLLEEVTLFCTLLLRLVLGVAYCSRVAWKLVQFFGYVRSSRRNRMPLLSHSPGLGSFEMGDKLGMVVMVSNRFTRLPSVTSTWAPLQLPSRNMTPSAQLPNGAGQATMAGAAAANQ